jgi:zinc transporter, ZIP family
LDGIPESIVIGTSLLAGKGVSLVAVAAVFLSNVPEGLSSAAGMLKAGRSASYVFGVWRGIALASAFAAIIGYALFEGVSPTYVAAVMAVAAGAILAMIADTMIAEAFETAHEYAGLVTVAGFLAAFALSKLNGV